MLSTTVTDIHILVFEPDVSSGKTLCGGLVERGFKNTTAASTAAEARAACINQMFDLILCDNTPVSTTMGSLPRTLRFGDIGENPYAVIFTVLRRAEPEMVNQAIKDGVDNLLARPFGLPALVDRITGIIHARKPFIFTSDYIGPFRQTSGQAEADVPQFEVPNTVRDKALNTYDYVRVLRDIRQINGLVGSQLIIDCLKKMSPIVTNVAMAAGRGGQMDLRPQLERLSSYMSIVDKKLKGTPDEHVGELCNGMMAVLKDLQRDYNKPAKKDILLMQNLAQAIYMSLKPDEKAAAVSKDIVSSVIGAKSAAKDAAAPRAANPWRGG